MVPSSPFPSCYGVCPTTARSARRSALTIFAACIARSCRSYSLRNGADPQMPSFPWYDMTTAPRDGTTVEVRHGPDEVIARAYWSMQERNWIREDTADRRTLSWVSSWRPAAEFP